MPNVLSEAGSGESPLTTTIVEPAGNLYPEALPEWHRPAADANRCQARWFGRFPSRLRV